MSIFGKMMGGQKPAPAPAAPTPPEPVAVPTPPAEAVVPPAEGPDEERVETFPYESGVSFYEMSKDELEEYGRTIGIELDKRHSHYKMLEELQAYLDTP